MFLNLYCINNAFNKSSLSIEREKGMDLTLLSFGHGYTARALTLILSIEDGKYLGRPGQKTNFLILKILELFQFCGEAMN